MKTLFTLIGKDADGFSSNTYQHKLPERLKREGESILVDHIDVWYDVHQKYWVIQFKSVEGYQLGSAEYSIGGGKKAAIEEATRLIASELKAVTPDFSRGAVRAGTDAEGRPIYRAVQS